MSKARKRRLSTNKPFIFVIIITLIMMFAYFLSAQAFIGMGIAIPVVMITEGSFDQQKILDLSSLFSIFGGFIVLIFYYFWYRPEYKWKRNKNEAWKFTVPILIYWVLFFGVSYAIAAGHCTLGVPTLSAALPMIAAGICEEVAFREVGISYMRRQLKGENKILLTLIFTGVTFGFTHLSNAFKGDFLESLIQSALASMLGIFFGAIFIRTGNIWPCILTHGLHDLLFAIASVHYDVEEEPLFLFVVAMICESLLMVWGLYLVRKEKHPEIEALWSEKWQIPAEPSAAE